MNADNKGLLFGFGIGVTIIEGELIVMNVADSKPVIRSFTSRPLPLAIPSTVRSYIYQIGVETFWCVQLKSGFRSDVVTLLADAETYYVHVKVFCSAFDEIFHYIVLNFLQSKETFS